MTSPDDLIEARRDYTADTLTRADLAATPLDQFTHWLQNARDRNILDATAMVLATTSDDGQPHSRVVLLKHSDAAGFCWYTCRDSDKGRELAANAQASLLFYWSALERQVRIEGRVTELPDADADQYFQSRPEGSRFSAAASDQSMPVDARSVLEDKVARLHEQYPDGQVPRPSRWGGYRLTPSRLEFWQGRADRLHDRFIYTTDASEPSPLDQTSWTIQRISP